MEEKFDLQIHAVFTKLRLKKNPSQYVSQKFWKCKFFPILLTLSVSKKGSQQVPRVHYQNFEVCRVNLHINQTETKLCTPNCKIKIQTL